MEKILYISFENFDDAESNGVAKKVLSQCEVFYNEGFDVTVIGFKDNKLVALRGKRQINICNYRGGWINRIKRMIALNRFLKHHKIRNIYIRYILSEFLFLNVLKTLKVKNNSRIIIEVPTYPYKGELMIRKFGKLIYLVDYFCNKRLKKYVDCIATFSADEEIFGIKTLKIINGIKFSSIKERKYKQRISDEINIIAIATMKLWHGYDRFIEGLNIYYKNGGKKKVILHLVGNGEEIPKYKNMVNEYCLKDNVIFYGDKYGEKLDVLYEYCDIALQGLGAHRINIFRSSSLKSREYGAKGMPIITSCEIDAFPSSHCDFILKVPEDESYIDIQTIINFYNRLNMKYNDNKNLIQEIRRYTKESCDMSVTMKPIIDFFMIT